MLSSSSFSSNGFVFCSTVFTDNIGLGLGGVCTTGASFGTKTVGDTNFDLASLFSRVDGSSNRHRPKYSDIREKLSVALSN